MKLTKYICAFAAFLVLLSGCGDGKKSEPGRVEEISTEQLVEKMNNKEDLAVVFTQINCEHCKKFMLLLDDYLPNHNLVLYDVVLDNESDRTAAQKQLEELFPDFTGTPDIYYIEGGELKSRFWDEEKSITEKTFQSWVNKYDLLGRESSE